MISPTKMLTEYLQIAHEGSQLAKHAGRCVMCGGQYQKGCVVEPFEPAESFTDYADLQHPSGTHICGACNATWRKEFMQAYTKSLVCKDGLFPFYSNNDVSYWLLNPPEPPFMMFISTQQLGHIVWKAPVSLSRDLLVVRFDDKVMQIRRSSLLEGIEAAKEISAALQERRGTKKFENPFNLDRSLERTTHGSLREDVLALRGEDSNLDAAINDLRALNAGERWALPHILNATSKTTRPEPKLLPGQFV